MKSSEACIKTITIASLPTKDQVTKHTSWLSPEFKYRSGFNKASSKFSIGMILVLRELCENLPLLSYWIVRRAIT